jgi:hypothetical protein
MSKPEKTDEPGQNPLDSLNLSKTNGRLLRNLPIVPENVSVAPNPASGRCRNNYPEDA